MSWGLSLLCIPRAAASADWIDIVNAWARQFDAAGLIELRYSIHVR
jgi:hypothetical protein